jgi:DNA-binding response OmpR family regulator
VQYDVRVLVAEDDEDIRLLIDRVFSHVGVRVTTVGNGADALVGLDEVRPHCLVLDLRMPVVDGMLVLSTMRANGSTVPAVMLTASVETEIEVDALEVGAFAVVRKPFQTRALLTVVARAIRSVEPDLAFPERFAAATAL